MLGIWICIGYFIVAILAIFIVRYSFITSKTPLDYDDVSTSIIFNIIWPILLMVCIIGGISVMFEYITKSWENQRKEHMKLSKNQEYE